MKRYEKYKNSGVQWIGEVPSHWNPCRFKNFVSLINTPSTDDNKIGLENIESGTGHFKETDSEFEGNGVQFVEDDIVYGKLRPYLRKVWLATNKGNAVGDFFVFRANKSNPSYIHWLMLSDGFTSETNGSTYGAKMPRVSSDFILSMRYVLPPLLEQQAIASFLDAKTKPIDDIIAKREKQIELLEEMKSAIISRAVTKGLYPEAKMKDSGIEWIGEIPKEWEMRKLKYILKSEKYNIKTGPFGTQLKGNDLREEGDVPVYNQRNVIDNQFHSPSVFVTLDKANELAGFHTKPNDVLITSRGTIGKAAILPNGVKEGVLHPCLIALRVNQDIVNLEYLLYYINGFDGFAINVFLESNATTIEVIYTDTLKNIFVTLPQLEEQKRIASYLDAETSKIDTRIAKRRKQIALLQEYKQALITAAVTGKIDVREYIL